MSRLLKVTFFVHMLVAVVLGVPLLVIPGRFLNWVGWAPTEPILTRILGAALLALAWGSFLGWRARERARVAILIETDAVFCVLGSVGVLRHLVIANYPLIAWALFAILAAFAVVWVICWFKK